MYSREKLSVLKINDYLCLNHFFFQATTWISQLRDATEHNLGDVGRNAEDVEALQQEHEKLEATARVRIISVLFLDVGQHFASNYFNHAMYFVVRLPNGAIALNGSQRNATQRNLTHAT